MLVHFPQIGNEDLNINYFTILNFTYGIIKANSTKNELKVAPPKNTTSY